MFMKIQPQWVAMAVMQIIDRNGLDPNTIGRMYLGTESALDGAKTNRHLHC